MWSLGEDDSYIYTVTAWFKREQPLYTNLDDFMELDELRKAHGIPLEEFGPANPVGIGSGDTGWIDPMKEAEESRQAKGLKREDYLIGDLRDPL